MSISSFVAKFIQSLFLVKKNKIHLKLQSLDINSYEATMFVVRCIKIIITFIALFMALLITMSVTNAHVEYNGHEKRLMVAFNKVTTSGGGLDLGTGNGT